MPVQLFANVLFTLGIDDKSDEGAVLNLFCAVHVESEARVLLPDTGRLDHAFR
jgi:hypothetical protein